jgi:hypothetical protein
LVWGVDRDLVFGSFLTPSAERPEHVVELARLTEQVGLEDRSVSRTCGTPTRGWPR